MKPLFCLLGLHQWHLLPDAPRPGERKFLCAGCGSTRLFTRKPLEAAIDASTMPALPAPAPTRRRPRLSVTVDRPGRPPIAPTAKPDAMTARAIAGVEDFAQALGAPVPAPVQRNNEDSRAASSGGRGPSPDASAEAAGSGSLPSRPDPAVSDMPSERDRPLPPKRASLLRLLVAARGADGICRAANPELAEALGCARGVVSVHLRKLEADGWIARTGSTNAREVRVLYRQPLPAAVTTADIPSMPDHAGKEDDEAADPPKLSYRYVDLLNEIISLSDETGAARPTNAALADALDVTDRAVEARLQVLDDRGYVGRSHDGEGRAIHILKWPDGRPFVADGGDDDDAEAEADPEPEPASRPAPPPRPRTPPPAVNATPPETPTRRAARPGFLTQEEQEALIADKGVTRLPAGDAAPGFTGPTDAGADVVLPEDIREGGMSWKEKAKRGADRAMRLRAARRQAGR